MEACGFDAYDCSTEAGQVLNTTLVRFVCIPTPTDSHPVNAYLLSTFYQGQESEYHREDMTCLGRLTVSDEWSYVSVDLGELSTMGYTVYSVELLNDGMLYDL